MSYYDHATMMAYKLGPWSEDAYKEELRPWRKVSEVKKLSALGTLYKYLVRVRRSAG